jgi:hypothetical protein
MHLDGGVFRQVGLLQAMQLERTEAQTRGPIGN